MNNRSGVPCVRNTDFGPNTYDLHSYVPCEVIRDL
jgi:hypothetical protein